MSVPTEIYVVLPIAIALILMRFIDLLQKPKTPDITIGTLLTKIKNGTCPECDAVHKEAITMTGVDKFWTNFVCPECNYKFTAHIRRSKIKTIDLDDD